MIIPNIWENKKMFQTTNQFIMVSHSLSLSKELHCGVPKIETNRCCSNVLDGRNEKLQLTCFVHVFESRYKCIHCVVPLPVMFLWVITSIDYRYIYVT